MKVVVVVVHASICCSEDSADVAAVDYGAMHDVVMREKFEEALLREICDQVSVLVLLECSNVAKTVFFWCIWNLTLYFQRYRLS